MSNKNPTDDTPVAAAPEEIKELGQKHPFSRFEGDLYREEDDITLPVIRVKRISTSNKVEKWKVMSNNTVVFVLEGSKLNSKEKEFLRTFDGFNFLLKKAKEGISSFSKLHAEIKFAIKRTQSLPTQKIKTQSVRGKNKNTPKKKSKYRS